MFPVIVNNAALDKVTNRFIRQVCDLFLLIIELMPLSFGYQNRYKQTSLVFVQTLGIFNRLAIFRLIVSIS